MLQCKRCLLQEMGDEELYERIKRTINAIPADKRCEENEYKNRLQLCRSCDKLVNGMCRVCGCFVEVRAAKQTAYCPQAGMKLW